MHWENASAFWSMGGYGLYVWGSFAVTAAALALEVALARKNRSQTLARLGRLRQLEEP